MKLATSSAVLLLALFCFSDNAIADTFGTGGNQFTIDFVTIGNPGNPTDVTGNPSPAGSVHGVYWMGRYEVSRDMVTKASAAGNLDITLAPMGFVTGGPRPDMPATGVSWNEAARFVNWLNISEGYPPAYKFSTQPGDVGYSANQGIELWVLGDDGFNETNRFRNRLARYVLPCVDQWYKAAYFDPGANGGAGGYWDFATGSDTEPVRVANGTSAGTAVYGQSSTQGPADVTQAGGLSRYGVMGLGGNVWEWEETDFDLVNDSDSSRRGVRGGDWNDAPTNLTASVRENVGASDGGLGYVGFRVAAIPEPSTLLLGALGALGLPFRRRKFSLRISRAVDTIGRDESRARTRGTCRLLSQPAKWRCWP